MQTDVHFRPHDVIFVQRYIHVNGRTTHYHHAGFVLEAENGKLLKVIDFDPTFDRPDQPMTFGLFKEAIGGIHGIPRILEGEELLRIFPPEDTFVYSSVPDDEWSEDIQLRIAMTLSSMDAGIQLLYRLHSYNCQHFATHLQTGTATSPDIKSLQTAITGGLNVALEAWDGAPTDNSFQPFDPESIPGKIGT